MRTSSFEDERLNDHLENGLTLADNFAGSVTRPVVQPGGPHRVPHGLGRTPAGRLILAQRGGGLITDGARDRGGWELVNAGTTPAHLTVFWLAG